MRYFKSILLLYAAVGFAQFELSRNNIDPTTLEKIKFLTVR